MNDTAEVMGGGTTKKRYHPLCGQSGRLAGGEEVSPMCGQKGVTGRREGGEVSPIVRTEMGDLEVQ